MCKTVVIGLLNALRNGATEITEYKDSLTKISIEISNRFSPASMYNLHISSHLVPNISTVL